MIKSVIKKYALCKFVHTTAENRIDAELLVLVAIKK